MSAGNGGRGWNIGLWVGQGALALFYGMAGFMKLTQPIEGLVASGMSYAGDYPELLTRFIGTMEVLGALGVIQFTTGSIIEPKFLGTGLNLSPVIMLLSLAVWGTIWGVVGMFLAVPMMVVLMIVCSHFAATRAIAVLLSTSGEVRV